jgi:ERCC4-type nuclease
LSSSPLRGVLVLEGGGEDIKNTEIRREAMQGALITTTLIFGIPVLRSFSPGETARLMVYAIRQFEADARGCLRRPGYRPKGKRKRQLFILQGLPGIGPKLAGCLLDHFGSIQGVLNASMESLSSVDGIGEKTARNIISMVREPVVAYGVESELKNAKESIVFSHDGGASAIFSGRSALE